MIENVLIDLGFSLHSENANFWRARPIYRESNNNTSLRINKETGAFQDYSAGIHGDFYKLLEISLNLSDYQSARKWLDEKAPDIEIKQPTPKIKVDKKFDSDYGENLLRHYSFYTNRENPIREAVLEEFECGIQMSGKMNNRFVFLVRDDNFNIVGLAGRDLLSRDNKWKLMGGKSHWEFPMQSIPHIKKTKEVFLVESVGDMLALYNAGYKNVFVMFGLALMPRLLNKIASLNPNRVIICTNDDSDSKKNEGQVAAEKIKKKLSKLMDEDSILIMLPPNGDLGDSNPEEIKNRINEI